MRSAVNSLACIHLSLKMKIPSGKISRVDLYNYRRFGEAFCFPVRVKQLDSWSLKMEVTRTSEVSVNICQSKEPNVPATWINTVERTEAVRNPSVTHGHNYTNIRFWEVSLQTVHLVFPFTRNVSWTFVLVQPNDIQTPESKSAEEEGGGGGAPRHHKLAGPSVPEGDSGPEYFACIFVFLGSIITCGLYQWTVSDQAQISDSLSGSVQIFSAGQPLLEEEAGAWGRGQKIFFTGLRTRSQRPILTLNNETLCAMSNAGYWKTI